MRIIGYAYECDTHCPECTYKRFTTKANRQSEHLDEHGLPNPAPLDADGNEIHPMFSTDDYSYHNDDECDDDECNDDKCPMYVKNHTCGNCNVELT